MSVSEHGRDSRVEGSQCSPSFELEDAARIFTNAELAQVLPWTVMIGPSGVGKTALVQGSALDFWRPLPAHRTEGSNPGGRCWATRRGVILEVPGAQLDADLDAWQAFLAFMGLGEVIRSVVFVVPIDALDSEHHAELDALGRRLRDCLAGLVELCSEPLSVHLVVSKCDMLVGFEKLFEHYAWSPDGPLWGLPLERGEDTLLADTFEAEFDALLDNADSYILRRMGEVTDVETRVHFFQVGEHLRRLRKPLAVLLARVFGDGGEGVVVRGCYFVSAKWALQPLASERDPLDSSSDRERRRYFVAGLFERVLSGHGLVHRGMTEFGRDVERLLAGLLVVLVCLGLWFSSRGIRATRGLLDEISTAVDSVDAIDRAGAPIANVDQIYPLYAAQGYAGRLHGLAEFDWFHGGSVLMPPTRRLFGRTVRETVVVPLMEAKINELRNFAARYPDDSDQPPPDEAAAASSSLRAYLLLAGSFDDYRGELVTLGGQEREDAWLSDQLAKWWAAAMLLDDEGKSTGMLDGPSTPLRIQMVTRAYVTILRTDSGFELSYEEELVEDVRKVLERGDRAEAWLVELIANAAEVDGVSDLALGSFKLGTRMYKSDAAVVRAAFTRQGWEKYCRSELAKLQEDFAGSEWVLGRTTDTDERLFADRVRLRSLYFAAYIEEWERFIAEIYLDVPGDLVGSLKMMQELARGGTPLRLLLKKIAWHTRLEDFGFPDNGEVRQHFAPFVSFGVDIHADADAPPVPVGALPIDVYAEQLAAVRDGLQAVIDDVDEIEALSKKIRTSSEIVSGMLSEQQDPWRSHFERLLRPPFDVIRFMIDGETNSLGVSWCNTVYFPLREQVVHSYPFNPQGYDLPIQEFAAWFAPRKGPLWQYYEASLYPEIVRKSGSEGKYVITGRYEPGEVTYNAKLPGFLTEVADIGMVLFPSDSEFPRFEFEIQIDGTTGISETIFTVDGQKVTYRHGPQSWTPVVWPGSEGDPGASIRTKGSGKSGDIVRKGDWGLWHLLGEAKIIGDAADQVYSVKWDMTDQGIGIITIRLRPKYPATPLFGVPGRGHEDYLGMFTSFSVPKSVVNGYACSE